MEKEKYYTVERNVQIVLSLLKAHGIRRVVVSPGATNVTFVASMQHDHYFEMYSCVDERSAAYMACGMAAQTGEPVVLSCTGATSSRNYMPGLTEAFYSKLPLLAITSSMDVSKVGHLSPQATDRSNPPKDVVKFSVCIQTIKDASDEWDCMIKANKAILELKRNGGGPVHINLITGYSPYYSVKELPPVRSIKRFTKEDELPSLPTGKIGIFVGSHYRWPQGLNELIEQFCTIYNAVVFCDHSSNYKGNHRVQLALIACQENSVSALCNLDLLIHIGEISGDYYTFLNLKPKQVWRVNEDGEIRDFFRKLNKVFDMSEKDFFSSYILKTDNREKSESFLNACRNAYNSVFERMPELPFSNIYIASKLSQCLPENSVLHLSILNSLRAWNFFEIPQSVVSYSNVGGFGIDGILSTLIGASLMNREKLFFAVIGDLAFFYDLNSLGNHYVGNNLRILLVNNGLGQEFRNYKHTASAFGDDTDKYIAAGGHFGNQSHKLVKHYAEDLGYEYLCASNKEEFEHVYQRFVDPVIGPRSIIFEVFTNHQDESDALKMMYNIEVDKVIEAKKILKKVTRDIIGNEGIQTIKKIIR